jgi:hypothetical protein
MANLAILITGFLRHHRETFSTLREHLLDRYPDVRLFVATWDIENNARGAGIQKEKVNNTPVSMAEIADFYSPYLADISMRNYSAFMRAAPAIPPIARPEDVLIVNPRAKTHGVFWMERIRAQWWIVRDGLRMIDNHSALTGWRPDLICRIRSDITLPGPLPDWPQDRVLVDRAVPSGVANDREWFSDWFQIGPAAQMMKLTDMPFFIERLYDRQNADVTNAENALWLFMVQRDIPLAVRTLAMRKL